MTLTDNNGGDPNYVGSDLKPIRFIGRQGENGHAMAGHDEWTGTVMGFTSEVVDDDFVQARAFWDMLVKQQGQQENLIHNVSSHLRGAAIPVRQKAVGEF